MRFENCTQDSNCQMIIVCLYVRLNYNCRLISVINMLSLGKDPKWIEMHRV